MLSPTSRLRKELRRRRRAAQKGSNLSASARKAPHTPVSPVLKHRKPKSFTTTRKTKPSSQHHIDRSKTPLITCWSSSDDSTAGWEEMKERIRFKNALRQKNQLNPNDIDWGSSSSEDEGFSVKLERMKLEQSAKKGSRRALREDVGSLECALGSLGFDNYQQSQREHVKDSKSNHQRSNNTTSLGKESSYPNEPGQLDEHELQVYNSLKLKLRGGTYDSNRTLCELIRRSRNDTSFASRETNKNNEAVMQDLKLVWGIGPHRAARFGEEILDALDSKENKRLLKLSRKNGLIRLGDKIDAAMEKLEDDTRKVVSSRKQSKAKMHCMEYDGDDDEEPKLPQYIAFDSQMGTL